MRRVLLVLLTVLVVAGALLFALGPGVVERSRNSVTRPPPYAAPALARQLHRTLFVADLHADPLLWGRDLLARASYGHVDVPRLQQGGVALQVFGVVTQVPAGQNYQYNTLRWDIITPLVILQRWPVRTWTSAKARALYQAHKLHAVAAASNRRFEVIDRAAGLQQFVERRRATPGLVAGLLAIEGLQAIEGDLGNLDVLYAAGFRMMGLTHFFDNAVGGSAHGMTKGGLSEFGRRVVQRMEERRILVDLAHASPRLMDDVLDIATRPVVVSHTGVKGTCDNIRNLSDAHVRRVAATGGLIGIGYWNAAVCDVSVAGIVRAVRYTVKLVGPDHVALGSDFNGATTTPFDTTGVPLITAGLLEAGFSTEDIKKIMGGNVLRLLRTTLPEQ
ncbi:MAG: dipeptidase [Candidatus Binatia bacterium]